MSRLVLMSLPAFVCARLLGAVVFASFGLCLSLVKFFPTALLAEVVVYALWFSLHTGIPLFDSHFLNLSPVCCWCPSSPYAFLQLSRDVLSSPCWYYWSPSFCLPCGPCRRILSSHPFVSRILSLLLVGSGWVVMGDLGSSGSCVCCRIFLSLY